ncbi:phytoene desaturase family protein [Luteolibacter marinus]|uniref:phytoene desaturase family protein n=1 Tax=Luteolibacter marinus TaxID=2776705 RepID=UPI0018664789|nr:phytoene desaturase family protein [Luteolibacter marinus]
MPSPRVAIIGAGLGGISAAISLRAAGYEVEVFEKNPRIGGKLNVLEKDGFTFDLGPSIFTLPRYFRDLFARAGREMDDYVRLEPVNPHWRNFFEDGLVLDLHQDMAAMERELEKLPGDPARHWGEFRDFLAYAREQHEVIEQGYFERGIDGLWEFLRYYALRKSGWRIDYRHSMAESIASRFSDPHLRAIFEYFIKYVGSSAVDSPGYMNLMPMIQFDHGLWYVRGGMYALAEGLGRLMGEMAIPVHLSTGVASIAKDGNRVSGLRLENGEIFPCDLVVSNMEVIPVYEKLLGEPPAFMKKLEKFQPACSGLVIHVGTKVVYPQLAHHNFFYSAKQHDHFNSVFHEGKLPEDPTIYVVAPTRSDPAKAPAGCDIIKILPHIPPLEEGSGIGHEDYLKLRERVMVKLERMGLAGLRGNIVTEDLLTPVDIERMYRSNRGSIYGVVTDWKLNRGFKAPKCSSKYKNLYFCGGSVNPGGGMPMAILSGQKVADRIIARQPPD